MKKTVYISLTADSIHHGHMKLFETARKYGDIIIGLLSDKAVAEHKRIPYLNFEQRKKILTNFKGVKSVIKQNEWDYSKSIKSLKPDFLVHGDDWKTGHMSEIRRKVLKIMKSYGGKLIEIPYTKGVSSSALINHLNQISVTPDIRRSLLRRTIESNKISKFLEAHSPLSAIIGENTLIEKKGKKIGFDGFWSSSLTDSTVVGKPDNESLDFSQRLNGVDQIFEVTTKPLIMDGDTGGKVEHFEMRIKSAERLGISALIIEDKKGLKKNSLLKDTSRQTQEEKIKFSEKISVGKKGQISDDFMIIARIESFILGKGLNDGLKRANAYSEAGADLILIHSKAKTPSEIFSFAKIFKKTKYFKPLVSVPSTYSKTNETELIKNGFKIVIYANHMLRAAYPAMKDAAKKILKNQRSFELEKKISSVKDVINLIK